MPETTRERYERLRRERRHQRLAERSIPYPKLLVAALGIMLIALLTSGMANRQRGSIAPPAAVGVLQATVVPLNDAQDSQPPPPTIPVQLEAQALVIDDWRFSSEPIVTHDQVDALLARFPGPLASTEYVVGDRTMRFSEIIVGQSALYSLNPKVLLTLMELHGGVLTTADPSDEQLDWAAGFKGEEERWRGLERQLRWAVRELRRGVREYPIATELVFADKSTAPIPEGLNPASYAVVRTLAATSTPGELPQLVESFVQRYGELFEDPRQPLDGLAEPASPFLSYPLMRPIPITSFFDHDSPFLTQNGSLVSYWDRRETAISYDGHSGWDWGAMWDEPVLAAAPGTVIFAGNSDDGCITPASGIILEHGNGYRTFYWHLGRIDVSLGQQVERGQQIGLVGSTGCATGPHLHFQVQLRGRDTDPYGWCGPIASDPWAASPMGILSSWLWIDRPNPCALPADAIVLVPGTPLVTATGAWQQVPLGAGGPSLWTLSDTPPEATPPLGETGDVTTTGEGDGLTGMAVPLAPTLPPSDEPESTAVWETQLNAPGRYRVLAYIPFYYNGVEDTTSARYLVSHSAGTAEVLVDQQLLANEWADLGVYDFDGLHQPRVTLTSRTGTGNQAVWAGTLVLIPAGDG